MVDQIWPLLEANQRVKPAQVSPEQRAQREAAAVVIQRFWLSLKWQKLVAGLVKPDLEQHLLEFEDEDVERHLQREHGQCMAAHSGHQDRKVTV